MQRCTGFRLLRATAPYGRGSVCCCKRLLSILSHDRKEAVSSLFQQRLWLCDSGGLL